MNSSVVVLLGEYVSVVVMSCWTSPYTASGGGDYLPRDLTKVVNIPSSEATPVDPRNSAAGFGQMFKKVSNGGDARRTCAHDDGSDWGWYLVWWNLMCVSPRTQKNVSGRFLAPVYLCQ